MLPQLRKSEGSGPHVKLTATLLKEATEVLNNEYQILQRRLSFSEVTDDGDVWVDNPNIAKGVQGFKVGDRVAQVSTLVDLGIMFYTLIYPASEAWDWRYFAAIFWGISSSLALVTALSRKRCVEHAVGCIIQLMVLAHWTRTSTQTPSALQTSTQTPIQTPLNVQKGAPRSLTGRINTGEDLTSLLLQDQSFVSDSAISSANDDILREFRNAHMFLDSAMLISWRIAALHLANSIAVLSLATWLSLTGGNPSIRDNVVSNLMLGWFAINLKDWQRTWDLLKASLECTNAMSKCWDLVLYRTTDSKSATPLPIAGDRVGVGYYHALAGKVNHKLGKAAGSIWYGDYEAYVKAKDV